MVQQHLPAMTFVLLFFATVSSFGSAFGDEKLDAEVSQIITQLNHNVPDAPLLLERAVRAIRKEYGFVEGVDRSASGEYGPRAKAAVPKLIKLLKAFPEGTGWSGLRNGFAAIGPDAAPALLELLRGDNATWRERAAMALGGDLSRGRRKPLSAVPGLITATRDKEQTVRYWSIRALGQIGPASKNVVQAIASALKDDDAAVRREAGRALARIGPAAKSATPQLIDQLQHNDISARGSAIFALDRIGPDARAAKGELIQLLKDEILREEASVALGRIGVTGRHVAELIELLSHDQVRSRQLAALNLARVGSDAKPAVAALIASLQEQQMREFAIHALGQIGADARPAVLELIKLLTSDSYFIRAGAAEALGRIGPDAKAAIPALKGACNDTNSLTRRHAKKALRMITLQSKRTDDKSHSSNQRTERCTFQHEMRSSVCRTDGHA
jgi:HEAT repeat protein